MKITEAQLTQIIKESASSILNETFSSPLLKQMSKEHGGIDVRVNGGMRDGVNAWQRGQSIDLSQVTDDMLDGEPYKIDRLSEIPSNAICFNDGSIVKIKPYNEIPAPEVKKGRKLNRWNSGIGDTGDHNRKPSVFAPDAKIQKQVYNPWGVSQKAAEAHYGRKAIGNNRKENDYISQHKEDYPDWRDRIYQNNQNIKDIKSRVLKESELSELVLNETQTYILNEAFSSESLEKAIQKAIKYIKRGFQLTVVLTSLYGTFGIVNPEKQQQIRTYIENCLNKHEKEETMDTNNFENTWEKVPLNIIGTVYNAVPQQCNKDCGHTASMFRLNLRDVMSHRIIAMERDLMYRLGLKYGDVIFVKGTNNLDGVWRIEDTMNKKFKGLNKIDFLVPKSYGLNKWDNLTIFKLKDNSQKEAMKTDMAPQLSPDDFKKQQVLISQGKLGV